MGFAKSSTMYGHMAEVNKKVTLWEDPSHNDVLMLIFDKKNALEGHGGILISTITTFHLNKNGQLAIWASKPRGYLGVTLVDRIAGHAGYY